MIHNEEDHHILESDTDLNEQSSDQFEEEFGDDLINDDIDLDENGILNDDEDLGLNENDAIVINDDELSSNNNLYLD